MTNQIKMSNDKRYDLGDRTFKLGQEILLFCRRAPSNRVVDPLVNQLVRCGTSIGANYAEADAASSKKDFINKIAISKKEANETKYWLRLLAEAIPEEKVRLRNLFKEAQELNLIFSAIIKKSRGLSIKT